MRRFHSYGPVDRSEHFSVERRDVVAARPVRLDVAAARQAAMGMDNASGSVVPDDFDAPLPPDVQRYFEGEDDEDPGLSRRGPWWVA